MIFIDEIDVVGSLPFSTDEFFAAIRACYNRRTEDPEFGRLAFCLLGVASPSDLIRDTRLTPFNIGRRIELTDFTGAEAAPLAAGLVAGERDPRALLERVLYWTGGHPYLTQRLCQAVAGEETVTDPAVVDRLCEGLFLSPQAQERDDNLLFVRERLLKGEADPAALLDLYSQVRSGKRVRLDDTNQLVSLLRLSGIVRLGPAHPFRSSGHHAPTSWVPVRSSTVLRVRNRIYERVFDRQWVLQHMPDAELRRQRAAYLRGMLRAMAGAAVIVAVVAGLAITAVNQAHFAHKQQRVANQQRARAEERERAARQYLYASQMNLAQQAQDEGDVARAQQILEGQRPEPGQEDLRGFEWRYLWRRCQDESRLTFEGHGGEVLSVAFSPDGRTLATGGGDSTIRLWDTASRREVATLKGHPGRPVGFNAVAFSPDGKILASGSGLAAGNDSGGGNQSGDVVLWDVASRREITTLRGHTAEVHAVAFSPDGQMLASGSGDHTVKLWAAPAGSRSSRAWREIAALQGYTTLWNSVAFSPDGRTLAIGTAEGPIHLWDIAARRRVGALAGHIAWVLSVTYSPDGQTLASGGNDNMVRLWDVATRREVGALSGQRDAINAVAFSPDGKTLATGSQDTTVKLWDVATRQELTTLRGHKRWVNSVAFSPDGRTLATGSGDMTAKLWSIAAKGAVTVLRQRAAVDVVEFSPDGRALATGNGDGTVRLWEVNSRHEIAVLKGHTAGVWSLTYSPDGKLLASGSNDHTVRLWDVASGHLLASLPRLKGGGWGRSVAFSPDGKTLAMQGSAAVQLWAREDPDSTVSRDGRSAAAAATPRQTGWKQVTGLKWEPGNWWLAFSPDGETLAMATRHQTVKLWDMATRQPVGALHGWADPPAVFSPDGRTLATGGTLGSIRLWDVRTRRLVASLRGRPGAAFRLSPDGKTLAVCSANTISLWNLPVRREVATLKGHTGAVIDVAFSPDGSALASGSTDGTVRLWQAAPLREADPLRIVSTGAGDRSVSLQWRPVPAALGYNLYRGPAGATRTQLVKLTPQPLTATSYIDHGPGLVNGRTQTYGLAAFFPAEVRPSGSTAAGIQRRGAPRLAEGPLVAFAATPVATPPGFLGYSINEGRRSGSARFDAATDGVTIRGSGADIWELADQFYFLSRPVAGDFQATVTALTRPTGADPWAKAGLMVRDSLEPGARHVHLGTTTDQGLYFQWRPLTDDYTDDAGKVISAAALRLPIVFRFTRTGDSITAHYSTDQGQTFRAAGDPVLFSPPLPKVVHVGLAITAHNAGQVSEAKFRDLRIEPLGR